MLEERLGYSLYAQNQNHQHTFALGDPLRPNPILGHQAAVMNIPWTEKELYFKESY